MNERRRQFHISVVSKIGTACMHQVLYSSWNSVTCTEQSKKTSKDCLLCCRIETVNVNPYTGVGSKMTPGVTLKALYDVEIDMTAMAFRENYSTGGRYLFLFLSRKICGRLKVTPPLYILGHGVIFDPRTILRSCISRLWKIAQIMEFI